MRNPGAGNRWKIVLLVTLFNLLWEAAGRGIVGILTHPVLLLALFLTYFSYSAMIEDLITRYRLQDYQVLCVAFLFGLAWQLLVPSGGAFVPPLLLGVNWGVVLCVNLVWWGPIQTLMGFYVANRLVSRDWDHPLLSRLGWGLSLFMFVFITLLIRLNVPSIAVVTAPGVMVMAVLMLASAVIVRRTLQRPEVRSAAPMAFERDKVMDYLSVFMVILFLISGTLLARNPIFSYIHPVNRPALVAGMVGSTIAVVIMLVHRLSSKRPIPV